MAAKNLYIHIPFCVQRCYYCDFTSTVYNQELAENYIDALGIEFARRVFDIKPETIFIGGGTPTALPLELLEELMDLIGLLDLSQLQEFTVEANPGTLTMEKLLLLKNVGVNRISAGVQSFQQQGLEILGRAHTAKQSRFAVSQIYEAGIDNLSLDLIYAWPGQSLKQWESDLKKVLKLKVPHVSCYNLSYPAGTKLAELLGEGKVQAAGEDLELDMFNMAKDVLEKEDLQRYEVSNYALKGFECLHNINYWQGGNYVGIGAGAHSYEGNTRFGNYQSIPQYINSMNKSGMAMDFVDEISPVARAKECAAIWLRMTDGIDRNSYFKHTGYKVEELLHDAIDFLMHEQLLTWSLDNSHLKLTDRAIPIADAVLSEIIE